MFSYLLLLFTFLSIRTVSATTNRVETEIDNHPRHLSFNQFSSVLKFDRYERFVEQHELGTLSTNDESWESTVSLFWSGEKYSSSSKNVKNEAQQLHPFLLCHLDKTSTSGRQRYEIIKEEIAKTENNSTFDFFMNELPVYNHNFDENESQRQKQQQQGHDVEKESDEEEIPYGACFYGSMSYVLARDVKGSNTFVTPMFTDLKIRREASLMSNGENINHKRIIAISVQSSPGIAKSQQQVLELAYILLDIEKSILDDSSVPSCIESSQLLTSLSVTVSSIDISSFTYELERSKSNDNIISNECIMFFIEYLAKQPQVLSVEAVPQTIMLNDVASWIIQGYPEENNTRPWFEAGIRGEGEIVQLLDSGIDESSCYLKDASGEVPLTTDYDLTGGRIDLTKRKIVQYVALNAFNGDKSDRTSHGTHIAATIAGKRADDGVTEIDGMVDGISPGAKIAFFDAHNDSTGNNNTFAIPSDISLLFYFGRKVGARIHSASWGVHVNGEYSERVRLIDTYFYDDADDEFIMFAAAGNDGLEGSSTVFDPSLAKNVISVGASHSHGDDLSNNMLSMDYIAAFSSRGPTVDGRIKPDIVAPGHFILSVAANIDECDPTVRPKYDPDNKEYGGVMFMSGTSMSCPVAVGAGALVRQYFREVYDLPIDISGTLLKAVLVNGAEALVGRSKLVYGTDFDISTQYDEFQGFGRVNLLNSLKHPSPNIDSPDLHVEDARIIEQGQTHVYEFNVCDDREFRVTIVWKDPPNGAAGCQRCLVNDLDLDVELDGQVYYPNGKTEKDDRNNIERVILDGFSNAESTVIIRVTASNLGYGIVQKYSLASTGCINNVEFVTPTPSPTNSCGDDEFEYMLEIFTDRRPEDTSWSLQYQQSGGIIGVGREGEYDKQLNSYTEKGCAVFECFIFVIKDSSFDGLCCVRGMGSYRITAGDEVLVDGDSFGDRQEIEQFCYTGGDTEEPTSSPTVTCGNDEFQYKIEITTDLRPDETRWEIRSPQIDGVERGYYTESNKEYIYYGSCIDYGCYELTVYDDIGEGSYQLLVGNNVVLSGGENIIKYDKRSFCYLDEEICDDCEDKTFFEKISNALSKSGHDGRTPKRMPNLDTVVCEENEFSYEIIITTDDFPGDTSWALFDENGVFIDSVEEGYYTQENTEYVHKGCLDLDSCVMFTIKDSYGDGIWVGGGYTMFADDIIMVEGGGDYDYWYEQTHEFCHGPSYSFSPSSYPRTPQACNEGQFRYDIIITTDNNPQSTWWELYPENPVVDSVPFMTYTDQLTTYKHFGCGTKNNCYEFIIFDHADDRSGLCCYFGDGSYSLSVDDEVLVKGDQFQEEDYFYELSLIYFEKKKFCVGNSPTTSITTTTPTLNPELLCGDDQFEYDIEIRTDYFPTDIYWDFSYSNGTVIESVEKGEYTIAYFMFDHQGCALFDCFSYVISDGYGNGLCCSYGNGGYTIKAGDVILAEGGQFSYGETTEFCYGPNITTYPSSHETENPTHNPTSLLSCNTNEFKYDLIITTDQFPSETSWELKHEDGTLIDSVEYGYYIDDNKNHFQSYCLPMGCFRFTIKDSFGDGLCCGYGIGGYEIKVGDNVLIEGGRFDNEDTKDFCYYGETNPPTISKSESATIQPTVLVCDDDDFFKYELTISTDYQPESTNWAFAYKYVDKSYFYAGGYNSYVIKNYLAGYEEPNTDYTEFGCAKYDSCFQFQMFAGFYKLTDLDSGMVIAQSTERYSYETFCHYFPLDKAIVTIIISFSISPTDVDVVSSVVTKSIQKILNGASAQIDLLYDDITANSLPSSCEDSKCEVNFEVCDGVCNEKGQEKSFLSFLSQALTRESLQNVDVFNVMRQSDTTDIFQNVESIDKVELQFDSDFNIGALTQEEPTECTTPLLQHFAQRISSTVTSAITFLSGSFSNEDDGLFHFQIEITADSYAFDDTSWELRYENGTLIDSIQEFTYSSGGDYDYEYNIYIHPYKLNHGCFKFMIKDRVGDGLCCNYGEGSYKIISGDEILAQGGEFESHETKQFCSTNFNYQTIELPNTYLLHYNNFNSFKLRIKIETSCNNPENTRWELYDANGKIIDSIKRGEYTRANATYFYNYCLIDGCYHFNIRGNGWSSYRLFIEDSISPLTLGINLLGARSSATFCHPSSLLNGAESVPVSNQHEKFDLEVAITEVFDDYFYLPRASWELSYLNGDVIDAAGGANAFYFPYVDSGFTPNEINGAYVHHNFVMEGCFTFTIRDPLFLFRVLYFLLSIFGILDKPPTLFSDLSYTILSDETVLAEGSDFIFQNTKRFCYNPSQFPRSCGKDEFKFQVDVMTDEWPHEIFWELTHEDGSIIENANKRYYTKENTKHIDTYCIQDGCYTFSIYDILDDGLCCSFGEGSYQIKVNNKVIKKGADFGSEETTLIGCPDTIGDSCENCEDKSLIEKITGALH